jgi:hypothetical protein
MSMVPWNGDIRQCLKWMQNNAPRIQALIQSKTNWYYLNNEAFWQAWQVNVFNLRTANNFGLMVWCIILGLPAQLFGLQGVSRAWAYGKNRQNYVAQAPLPPNPNTLGGNFYGGGNTTLISLAEVRWTLLLRYAMLVGNGRIEYVNRALKNVFSPDDPWDLAAGKFAYVKDVTSSDGSRAKFEVEYVFGAGLGLSPQFLNLLRAPQYGVLPRFAGSKIIVTEAP